MHKPSEFEVMHFIPNACVWLHQGFNANPTFLHGYGLCCRMSDPNQPNDVTSGSNVVNPPDTGRHGRTTRQQSAVDALAQAAAAAAAAQAAANRAQAASQGAQSATASIDYHSLATAMSRLNDDSASNIEKGTQPKWDFKGETFVEGLVQLGPHNSTDAARRRLTQNNCRSRFPGLSCTHKRPRILHRSHVVIQSPQARKPS